MSISDDHFGLFLRYPKSISAYKSLHAPVRSLPTRALFLWGPTGTGKTYAANRIAASIGTVFHLPEAKGSGLYWDNFDHDVVIVDEMTSSRFRYTQILTLIDSSPLQVPVHGGLVNFAAKLVIFCSNLAPFELYSSLQSKNQTYVYSGGPLERRFTTLGSEVRHMDLLAPFVPFVLTAPTPVVFESPVTEAMVDIDEEGTSTSRNYIAPDITQ